MMENLLYVLSDNQKKGIVKYGLAFAGGVAVGYLLTKALNPENVQRIKDDASSILEDLESQGENLGEEKEEEEVVDIEIE